MSASRPQPRPDASRSIPTTRPGGLLPVLLLAVATMLTPVELRGQELGPAVHALAGWAALDVPTGYETRVAEALAAGLDGFSADRWGNLVRVVGDGGPVRVVACGLDEPALAATQITEDGYLRVHRIGRGPAHPLWDQQFAWQQVRILTPEGPVAGVVAGTNGHFSRQHRDENDVLEADDLWVDVGAESRVEVARLGITLLDPVIRHLPPWPMPSGVAGPAASGRVGCAVVATLAERAASGRDGAGPGATAFVLSAQSGMGWVGLSGYVARHPSVRSVVLLDRGTGAPVREQGGMDRLPGWAPDAFDAQGGIRDAAVTTLHTLAPAVRDPGSHLEYVTLAEARSLLRDAAEILGMAPAGVEAGRPTWVSAPVRAPLRTAGPLADAGMEDAFTTLRDLVELHAVPAHEWSVRRYVLENLPEWARRRAVVDDMGNIAVAVGPDRDTTVFMAHLDEVGYEITSIDPSGVVTLASRGGTVDPAWEGQTALIHFDPEGAPSSKTGSGADTAPVWKDRSLAAQAPSPLPGIFLVRERAGERDPPEPMRAWFGMDREALAARGVEPGMAVTSHKEGLRLGEHRFVARALDDRAGTTALLRAVRALDPERLPAKVIFTWSVHEEGGLVGAAALARRFGATASRIYSVDTFVSSDTPLESPHFAYAPLGAGPVLRAIENSSVSPDRERARVRAAAERAGIPLQTGLTQGGTDGTTFTYFGAPNQGLSWPGRYSHAPGEVLDLRDLVSLTRLILALAYTP